MALRKTHDGPDMGPSQGKQRQFGKYQEQGGASRSNNFTSMGSPRTTPVKVKGKAQIPNPMDILAAPQKMRK